MLVARSVIPASDPRKLCFKSRVEENQVLLERVAFFFVVEWTRQIIVLCPEKELLVPDRPLIGRTRAVFSVWRSYITIHVHTHAFSKTEFM